MELNLTVPGSGAVPAYAALADCVIAPAPGVVVVHEAFGLTDDIRRIADRFAASGYHALAPDLMSHGSTVRCMFSLMRQLRAQRGAAFDTLLAARDLLAARADCTGEVGVAGFCMGGAFALLAASRGFGATAVQYGQLPRRLDEALSGACPVVASYGARDRSLRGAAGRLETALTEAGVRHDVKEYPGAGHSFMGHDDGPAWLAPLTRTVAQVGYVDTAAEDAWTRILAMFGSTLHPDPADTR